MKNIFLLSCWLFAQTLFAQTLPYVFSVQQGVYTPLSNAVSVNNGEVWDDLDIQVPLGFNFQLLGQTMSSLYMDGEFALNIVSIPTDPSPLLFAYGADLIDLGINSGESLSPISYQVTGAAGSRIFKIEWANAGFYDDENGTDFINTQLWLFEGSNDIELHFGPNQIQNPDSFSGFTGPVFGFVQNYSFFDEVFEYFWYLRGPVNDPVIDMVTLDEVDTLTQTVIGAPGDGLIYRFASTSVGTKDISLLNDQVRVFPSLASEAVTIAVTDELALSEKEIWYEMVDQLGQTVRRAPLAGTSAQVDVSGLATGFYFMNLVSSTRMLASKKIVKQ